jgi:hypothetical protein
MNISRAKLDRIKELAKKHSPELLSSEGIFRAMFNLKYGNAIAKWRLEGYSDEQIIKKIEELESRN